MPALPSPHAQGLWLLCLRQVLLQLVWVSRQGSPDRFIGATQWCIKCVYEILATPATYAIVGFLKRTEKTDHYDYDTDFNPFALRRPKEMR